MTSVALTDELLRQVGHHHGLADRHVALDRRGRLLEAVARLGIGRRGARLEPFLLLVAGADIAGDVQFLAAAELRARSPRLARIGLLARRRMRRARRLPRGAAPAPPRRCRSASSWVRSSAWRRASSWARTRACSSSISRRLADSIDSRSRRSALGLGRARLLRGLGFATLRVDLLLRGAVLLLEHVALDVGALDAHFDADGARAALRAGQLQFALRLALERDARRRRAGRGRAAAVAAAQVRQQLELGVLADQVIGAGHAMPAWSSCASSLSTGTLSASAN